MDLVVLDNNHNQLYGNIGLIFYRKRKIEINGGNLDITMAEGDTDALDANGTLTINGGYINITAQFAFDFDLTASLNGGTVIVNGTQVTSITNSMMEGGEGPGGQPGQGGFSDPR